MRHLKAYESLNESGGQKLIPFLLDLVTYDTEGVWKYYICGAFPTFTDFAHEVADDYALDFQSFGKVPKTIFELIDSIDNNLQRGGVQWSFWSDGLVLAEQKEIYRIISNDNPYRVAKGLNLVFRNAESIMNEFGTGNPDSLGYLAQSVENNPESLGDYSPNMQDKILKLTSWDQKKIDALVRLNRISGQF